MVPALILGAALAVAAVPADAASCPDKVFRAVRDAVTALEPPPYIRYVTVVEYETTIGTSTRHFRTTEAPQRDRISVSAISREEVLDPPNPFGTNVVIFGFKPDSKKRRLERDHLGVPALSPLYTFGLTERAPRSKNREDTSGLPVIGRTAAVNSAYDVACSRVEDAYALRLRPTRDPARNTLRELLVDAGTLLPRTAVVRGNFDSPSLRGTSWTVTFQPCFATLCVAEERTEDAFVAPDRVRVQRMRIAFEKLEADRVPFFFLDVEPAERSAVLREPSAH